MLITIDTREQTPFSFDGLADVQTERGTLTVGDYSLRGLEAEIAVERKSLPDLIQCLGRERDRFQRELERGRALKAFCVMVEGDWRDVAEGRYKSLLNPKAATASILAFSARLGVPFLFAGTREHAARATAGFLWQYAKGEAMRLKAVERAIGENVAKGGGGK